ncbi:hypothetical protein QJS66_17060 [Kocuria rhizophila]|nr:hypothetical protein QJS66_17060 [Kocuria rhizophila]
MVVNHFKSKGSGPKNGPNADAGTGGCLERGPGGPGRGAGGLDPGAHGPRRIRGRGPAGRLQLCTRRRTPCRSSTRPASSPHPAAADTYVYGGAGGLPGRPPGLAKPAAVRTTGAERGNVSGQLPRRSMPRHPTTALDDTTARRRRLLDDDPAIAGSGAAGSSSPRSRAPRPPPGGRRGTVTPPQSARSGREAFR